jgi:hypothetical protein
MKHFTPVVLLSLIVLVPGCIWDPPVEPPPTQQTYLAPTSPENVIHNLQALFANRDPVEYDSTLADGYVFRFALDDITQGRPDSLIRAEEMSFAENLFVNGAGEGYPPATTIKLVIGIVSHGPDNRIGHESWVKYVVNTDLTVNFADRNPLTVKAPGWLYFRQQPEGSGRWRLAEWADQSVAPAGGAPGRALTQGAQARALTWGGARRGYR